jgi:hypothetical protein
VKKTFIIFTITLLTLIGLFIAAVYAILQTRHAAPAISQLLSHVTGYSINVSEAKYTPPLQLSLQDVSIVDKEQKIQLPIVELWFSPEIVHQGKLSFDSILVEQANLDWNNIEGSWFESFNTHQVALKHVDINGANWSARDVSLQIDSPQWTEPNQHLPYGDIQLAAQQVYVRGEALDNLLVDIRYQATESTIFGSSFHWRGASISGQAEQYSQGWSLVNVTIDGLKLPDTTPASQLFTTLKQLNLPINNINSLDILNGSFRYGDWQFSLLDASLEQLNLHRSLWQQDKGYISFNAERIASEGLELFSPRATINLNSNQIQVKEFDGDIKQGRLQLSGDLTQKRVKLDYLKLAGIKWLEGTEQLIQTLHQQMAPINELVIGQLDVENSQFIQVEHPPFWQVSGLNIDGKQLQLVKDGALGLFQGQLEISTNSANYDKLIASQAHVKASATQQTLSLERAFIPLEQGYIEASGEWETQSASAPWQLRLHADGVPLQQSFIEQWLPFELTGLAEFDIDVSGLSGDYAMFAHSLSGHIHTNIHGAELSAKSADGEQSFQQPWPLDEIKLDADRGRLTIHSASKSSEIAGNVDLTKPEFATLILRSQHQCHQLWSDLIERANQIEVRCAEPSIDSAPPANQASVEPQEPSTDL